MSRDGYVMSFAELIDELVHMSDFYSPIVKEALPRLEDDGGPVYNEEERRVKCQAISS